MKIHPLSLCVGWEIAFFPASHVHHGAIPIFAEEIFSSMRSILPKGRS